MGLSIPPLRIKIMVESNPPKSTMLAGRLGVSYHIVVYYIYVTIIVIVIVIVIVSVINSNSNSISNSNSTVCSPLAECSGAARQIAEARRLRRRISICMYK